MFWAAKHGNLPAIRAILQSGVDVNMTYGTWKRTGLHLASEHDQVDAVKLLLEAGADPNIRDEEEHRTHWHVTAFVTEGRQPTLGASTDPGGRRREDQEQ